MLTRCSMFLSRIPNLQRFSALNCNRARHTSLEFVGSTLAAVDLSLMLQHLKHVCQVSQGHLLPLGLVRLVTLVHSISHNFSLEGQISTSKHFPVAYNELFHMVHLTQRCISTQIWPFFALVPWINIHEMDYFEYKIFFCIEHTM